MNGNTEITFEIGTIKRETGKAILVTIDLNGPASSVDFSRGIWFPKSCTGMTDDGRMTAPFWLLSKKVEEINNISRHAVMMFGMDNDENPVIIN